MRAVPGFIASSAVAAMAVTGMVTSSAASATPAHASGLSETIYQVNTAAGNGCYFVHSEERQYDTHSSTKGWVRESSPRVTDKHSEHCYAKSGPQAFYGTTEVMVQGNTMINAFCYSEFKQTVVYETHSSTKGWVREPSPRVTTVISEHCYAKA